MLQAKTKITLELPESSPLIESIAIPVSEPVRLPRPGRPWTIADLESLAGAENRYELVRGDLLMMTPSSPAHGRYASRLTTALSTHVEAQELGEVYTAEPGFILKPEPDAIVRAPDVAFVRKEPIPPPGDEEGFWHLAPDLVIVIISPSESADSVQAKVQDYLAAGMQCIWLVYPKTRLIVEYQSSGAVRQISGEVALEGRDLIPGFRYSLKNLFKE